MKYLLNKITNIFNMFKKPFVLFKKRKKYRMYYRLKQKRDNFNM